MIKSLEKIIINGQNCKRDAEVARANNHMSEIPKKHIVKQLLSYVLIFIGIIYNAPFAKLKKYASDYVEQNIQSVVKSS